MDYKITNIKVSVKCQNLSLDTVQQYLSDKEISFKKFNNYIVFKKKYTYIVFKKNLKQTDEICHVNITNIKCLDVVQEAADKLKEFCSGANILFFKIDNITVSKDFLKEINLKEILSRLPIGVNATYNSETFPGVFLKFPNKQGTAILFHTGKCVLLGCKLVSDIESILSSLNSILT